MAVNPLSIKIMGVPGTQFTDKLSDDMITWVKDSTMLLKNNFETISSEVNNDSITLGDDESITRAEIQKVKDYYESQLKANAEHIIILTAENK